MYISSSSLPSSSSPPSPPSSPHTMTISNTPAYQLHTTGLPKPSVPSDYNRYFFDPTPALTQPRIVGLLACQRDPYLRNLTSEITASRKFVAPQLAKIKGKDKKSGKNAVDGEGNNQNQITIPGELWEVEFVDTVLFPEGTKRLHHSLTPMNLS